MNLELKGKRALITGGSVGIGLAVAHALAAEGVDVAICARDKERVEREAAGIAKAHGVHSLGLPCDVTKPSDIQATAARARGGGVILNTASICAKQPLGYEPIYNTTKAALLMFSKCLANELVSMNIRVNAVNPGLILTPDWRKTAGIITQGTSTSVDEYLEKIAKDNAPIGRFASPEELASFYVFLCSARASYCVGSSYYVDGGWLKTVE